MTPLVFRHEDGGSKAKPAGAERGPGALFKANLMLYGRTRSERSPKTEKYRLVSDKTKNTVIVAAGAGLAVGAATLTAGPGTALAVAAAGIGLGGMAGNLLTSGISSFGSTFQKTVLDRFASVGQPDELATGLSHASTTALRRVIENTSSNGKSDPDVARWQNEIIPFCNAALAVIPEVTAPANLGDIAVTIARGTSGGETGLQRQLEVWALGDLGRALKIETDQFPPEFTAAFRGDGTSTNPGWFNVFRELIVRQQARDERFARAWQTAMMALLLETVRGLVDGGSPPLDPGSAAQSKHAGLDRFVYTRRWTHMVGRDVELDRLMVFADPARGNGTRFMLVAGPGGRGKSRLALEACQLAAERFGMYAGFLSPRAAPEGGWQRWKPAVPTFIVIDYAASRAAEVHDMLVALTLPGRVQSQAVRVLLLEREAGLEAALGSGTNVTSHRTWIDIISGGSSNEAQAIEGAFDGELILNPVADPWPIMEMVFAAKAKAAPPKTEALAALRVVDPSGSPLFAILVADALADGEAIGGGDRYQFLRKVIHKQSVLPGENGLRELALNNAAVSTIARHVEAAGLLRLYENYGSALAPRFRPPDDDMNGVIDAVAGLTGHRDGTMLHGLEPDLLGEVLILSRCERSDANGARRADTLRELTWHIPRNNPPGGPIRTLPLAYGATEMLRLCCSDFPEDTVRSGLLEAPSSETSPALSAWAAMMRGIIYSLTGAGKVDLARELFSGAVARAARRSGAAPQVAGLRLSAAAEIAARLFDAGDYRGTCQIGDDELGLPTDRNQEDEFTRRARLDLAERYVLSALALGDIAAALRICRADLLTTIPIGSARHAAWILPMCARAITNAMLTAGDLDAAENLLRKDFAELKNTSEIARDILVAYMKRGDHASALRILSRWPEETEAWKAIERTESSTHEKEMQARTDAVFAKLLTAEVAAKMTQPMPLKELSRKAEWQADRAAGAYFIWFSVAVATGWLRADDFSDDDYIFGWPRRDGKTTDKWLVFFNYADAHLSTEAQNTVCMSASSAICREQCLNPEFAFTADIVGRTDTAEVPSERSALSLRRAEAIANLLALSGARVSAPTVRGIGVSDPMTPTGEGVREPKNRRASIEVSHPRLPSTEPSQKPGTEEKWKWLNRFFRDEIARYATEHAEFPIPREIARKSARSLMIMRDRVPQDWLALEGAMRPSELQIFLA